MRRLLVACVVAVVTGVVVSLAAGASGGTPPSSGPSHRAAGATMMLPRRGGAVVFGSDLGIYVANVDGSALTRLTTGRYDHNPVWSPDARRIAFTRSDAVLVMNANGSGLRRIGTGDWPAWSPDGTRIAFHWGDGIAVVNANGANPRLVVPRSALGFSWSPDGRRIAYSGEARIRLVELANGTSTTLGTTSFANAWRLAWSPDGATIAFDSDGHLELIDVATGRVSKLAKEEYSVTPVWSPDNARLAFVDGDGLFTIERNGDGRRHAADIGDTEGAGQAASWSADGTLLLFERSRYAGSYESDIWRVNADGTSAQAITSAFPTGTSYSRPRWANTTIQSRLTEEISTVSLRPARLLRTAAPVYGLSADGRRAAVATGDCDRIAIWNVTGTVIWLRGTAGTCGDNPGAIWDLVLSGTRAAWTYESETNTTADAGLWTASPGVKARLLRWADHTADNYLGNLAGDGPLLVYNTWRGGRPVTAPALWQVVGARTATSRMMPAGPNALDVVAVDAGRIGVHHPDGTFVLLSSTGKQLSSFHLRLQGIRAVRLTGRSLVVLRGTTIEVRDATTGVTKQRWPTSGKGEIWLEDAQGQFAAYTAGVAIHLLHLTDGRDRALAIANEAGPVNAQLEPEGLYYSYQETGSAKPGRVAFVPIRTLAAKFR